MDGNVALLRDICDLAEQHKALVLIDECHATGFFRPTGRGTEEYFKLDNKVDIINSTLGEALAGAAGGYTTGLKELIDLLRLRSQPYLFSNSLPPSIVACASKALDLIMANNDLPQHVSNNTIQFHTKMKEAGFTVASDPEHPICPVMLKDAKLASTLADLILEKACIHVQLSAAHAKADVDQVVDAFVHIGRKLGVIS